MPKYIVVIEIDGGTADPPEGVKSGRWIRYLYEEVEAALPELACEIAEHQVCEREDLKGGQCLATGLANKKLDEWRAWSGLL